MLHNDTPNYGPHNPHPLSKMKTELVWEGKYDEYGNRRLVSMPGSPLPLQRIETIDAPRDRIKAQQLGLLDQDASLKTAHRDDFRNMLIWGDNKLGLAALLEQFRGNVDLIYIDPPFDVGADFMLDVQIGEDGTEIAKEPSLLEAVAYRDMWGKGTNSYLHMMYERLTIMRELLSDRGCIYVHCDWRVSYYLREILDDIFDTGNFRNEIVWSYRSGGASKKTTLPRKHDTILLYAKSNAFQLHGLTERQYLQKPFMGSKVDEQGRIYVDTILRDVIEGAPLIVREDGRVAEVNCRPVLNLSNERLFYPTQKPEGLLELLLRIGSVEGDLVLDCFCGSGTTVAVAEKLGRRWIGVDVGRYSIHTTWKRLIGVQRQLHEKLEPYRSFDLYNLGGYERQWWQRERLRGADTEHRRIVLQFYKAVPAPVGAHPLLHGTSDRAWVYVAQIDRIFTFNELRNVAEAAREAGGRELHCLAWEFEMELVHKKHAIEAETGLTIRLKHIPREIMEANRTEVQFFEVGALEVRTVRRGDGAWDVELVRFTPSLAEAPQQEITALRERAISSPFDFIDFWAVDFAWREGKPFEQHWQDFRTRKDRSLNTRTDAGWRYDRRGPHAICVKVIDVFGMDTTTVIEVNE